HTLSVQVVREVPDPVTHYKHVIIGHLTLNPGGDAGIVVRTAGPSGHPPDTTTEPFRDAEPISRKGLGPDRPSACPRPLGSTSSLRAENGPSARLFALVRAFGLWPSSRASFGDPLAEAGQVLRVVLGAGFAEGGLGRGRDLG